MTRAPTLFLLGGSLGAIAPGWARVPVLLYAPVERSVRFATLGAPGGPAIEITFYGIYLCAAICALALALVGVLWDRRASGRGAGHSPLLTAWALTALAIATAYQLWNVWP
ncbi:MAG: hypothetical protein ABI321_01855 [Polyangia bacterium]